MQIVRMTMLVAATMSSAGAAAAVCHTDPVALARALHADGYAFYYERIDTPAGAFDAAFARVLEREYACTAPGEQCAIGADPWLLAQDGETVAARPFELVDQQPGRAVVRFDYLFRLGEPADDVAQRVEIVLAGDLDGCWRIADFVMSDGDSLRHMLEQWHAEFGEPG